MGTFSRLFPLRSCKNYIGKDVKSFPHWKRWLCQLLFITRRFASPAPAPIQIYFVPSCNKNEIALWTENKESCIPLSKSSLTFLLRETHYWETRNKSLPKEAAIGRPTTPIAFFLLFPPTEKLDALEFEVSSKDNSSRPLPPSVKKIILSTVHCWVPKMDLWNGNQ